MSSPSVDESRLEAFMGTAVSDMSAAISAPLVVLGDRLGLYRAMAGAGPLTPAEVAERAGCAERYVREWLANQAAGGYVVADTEAGTFTLPPEQAAVLADQDSPFYVGGAYEILASVWADHE